MSIKSIIKLFIPPIILKIKSRLSIYRKKNNSSFVSTINNIKKNSDTLIVIGNGPSLKETLEKNIDMINTHDSIVVNHFCETKYYKELKPKYYLVADPAFFSDIDSYADWLQEKIRKFIVSIVNNTTWNLNLVVPDFAKDGYLINALKKNPMIKIFYYNTRNFQKYSNFIQNWNYNYIAPPAQTVLNTCVYLGIFLDYKEINILGMDMSWHEDLELDQKTNELFIVDKHFYGTKKRLATLDVNGIKPAKVHEYLRCSVNALENFWKLREFADFKGCKVYNLSKHSWVDAFERKI